MSQTDAGTDLEHSEQHRSQNIGWLRAAVLGANDGIVSTASLIVGVAAAETSRQSILIAGVAGLVAGAMSMAAGEYVSVSSQADTEKSDRDREKRELDNDWNFELDELTDIYVSRGLDNNLARKVAVQLMDHDALTTHLRDELGLTEQMEARPVQAAFASAASFAIGAVMPLLAVLFVPLGYIITTVSGVSMLVLIILGALSSIIAGAKLSTGIIRITFWGAAAMLITAGVGALFGVSV